MQSITIEYFNTSKHRVQQDYSALSAQDARTLFVPGVTLYKNQAKRILGVPIFQSNVQVNYIDSLQKLTTKNTFYFWFIRKRNVLEQIYANRRAEF